jgi:hypothetical protein
MGSSMRVSERFILDGSDLEDMLFDDIKHAMVIIAVKNLQDLLWMKMRCGSIVGRLCIPWICALGFAA